MFTLVELLSVYFSNSVSAQIGLSLISVTKNVFKHKANTKQTKEREKTNSDFIKTVFALSVYTMLICYIISVQTKLFKNLTSDYCVHILQNQNSTATFENKFEMMLKWKMRK